MCEEMANKDKEHILGCGKNYLGSVSVIKYILITIKGDNV